MHRFFLSQPLTETLTITDEQTVHQILKVFRAKKGDDFTFFSEGSEDYIYEFSQSKGKSLQFTLKEKIKKRNAKKVHLTIFQAYPHKMDTLEMMVQKLVELGAKELVLYPADRSQISDISENKKVRLEKIAREALEQCGGNIPLSIAYAQENQGKLLKKYAEIFHIVGNPHGSKKLPATKQEKLGFWVGPEGGWSPQEEAIFSERNVYGWCFNDQVLRLETAAIVGTGILLYSTGV